MLWVIKFNKTIKTTFEWVKMVNIMANNIEKAIKKTNKHPLKPSFCNKNITIHSVKNIYT